MLEFLLPNPIETCLMAYSALDEMLNVAPYQQYSVLSPSKASMFCSEVWTPSPLCQFTFSYTNFSGNDTIKA